MTLQTCAPKISAHVDRGQSGGSLVRGPGSDDPHRCERKSSSFLAPVTKIPEGVVIGFGVYRDSWVSKQLFSIKLALKYNFQNP